MKNTKHIVQSIATVLFINLFFIFIGIGQAPAGYYDAADGLVEENLKDALNDIIDNHIEFPYSGSGTDTWDILKETDRDPNNQNNVILLYSGWSINGPAEYNNNNGWNREHVWAKSHGDFGTSPGPGTDVHMLRPCDISVNGARGNRYFGEGDTQYNDPDGLTDSYTHSSLDLWEPRDEVKGDVARIMFYMATRYAGEHNGEPDLTLVDYIPTSAQGADPVHGVLSVLLQWNEDDPVDQWERDRNDIIYNDYQENRNPFIDHPEYANDIWDYTPSDIITTSSCDSYTVPSGDETYTTSGNYNDTIPNMIGGDSVITINLTINNSTTSNITPSSCDSYTVPSGDETYTTNGNIKDTIPNTAGCDSVITIDLTINNSTTSNITPSSCESYTVPSGDETYTTGGNYMDTIPNTAGCDSIISINLTITNVYNSITLNGSTLTANASEASFQWINCDTYTPINNATTQSFTPSENGDYAVIVTEDGCTDTSNCLTVNTMDLNTNKGLKGIKVFPNPTEDEVTVFIENNLSADGVMQENQLTIELIDITGRLLSQEVIKDNTLKVDLSNYDKGVYMIRVTNTAPSSLPAGTDGGQGNGQRIYKVIKE